MGQTVLSRYRQRIDTNLDRGGKSLLDGAPQDLDRERQFGGVERSRDTRAGQTDLRENLGIEHPISQHVSFGTGFVVLARHRLEVFAVTRPKTRIVDDE